MNKDLVTLRLEIEEFLDGKFIKDPFTPTVKKLLMDFYMLLLEIVTYPQAFRFSFWFKRLDYSLPIATCGLLIRPLLGGIPVRRTVA